MGSTRTEIVDGKEITIVEDSREDIQDSSTRLMNWT